jgi:hypothetical protein
MKNLTVLEKILLSILGVMLSGWLGWLSVTVVGLSEKTREDTAQWAKIQRLEERINNMHTE